MRLQLIKATGGRFWLAFAGLLAFLMLTGPVPVRAQAGDVILSLKLPDGNTISFTDGQLRELDWVTITSSSRWTEGVKRFEGPSLKSVLLASGLPESDLRRSALMMSALNDFHVGVAANDAWLYDPILARTVDGEAMRVRDKGPLWLVYPRDTYPELQNSLADERWIWQLSEIAIH